MQRHRCTICWVVRVKLRAIQFNVICKAPLLRNLEASIRAVEISIILHSSEKRQEAITIFHRSLPPLSQRAEIPHHPPP